MPHVLEDPICAGSSARATSAEIRDSRPVCSGCCIVFPLTAVGTGMDSRVALQVELDEHLPWARDIK